jgi:putative hydrolase of the HAD superfamily
MPSIRLFDGVRELLRDLRRSYELGLLTNGQPDMQWPKIRTLGIEGSFDAIVVSGEVGVYKPNRGAFDILLGRLGVEAAHALYVGDSQENDVAGAKAAGMRVAWVRTDGAGEAGGVAPDLVVDGAVELRGMLL